ncbi:MAG: hypothetical protein KatS3mg118_2298 [Paracoccaceae bacterium]|nr:MAG: hypothetical protein KatS3mg118_2298 [Paracoccaceae bacterium]
MHGFLDVLSRVGADPMSWLVIAVLALWVAASAARFAMCRLAADRATPEDLARHARRRDGRHRGVFLAGMLGAMGLAIAGLFGLGDAEGPRATLSFFALALGLFLILTLPVRVEIREAEDRFVAAGNPEARSLVAASLRQAHRRLLAYEAGILGLLALIALMF